MSRPGESYEPILEGWAVASIVADICQRAGIPFSGIDASLLEGFADGFSISNRTAAFSAIGELASVFQFDGANFDGAVQFIPRGEPAAAEFGVADTLDVGDDSTSARRDDPLAVAAVRRLEYYDTEGGLTPDMQTSDRSLGRRAVSETLSETTVIMRADDAAKAVVIGHKVAVEDARGVEELQLPLGWIALTPSDVVRFEQQRMRVESVEVDETSIKVKLRHDRASAYQTSISGVPAAPVPEPPALVAAATVLQVFDIPPLADDEDLLGLRVAVTPATQDWRGSDVELSRDGGASWPDSLDALRPATMGLLAAADMPSRSVYLPDSASSIEVELIRPDMDLEHAELVDMMNRVNLALIDDELVNFGTVEQLTPTRWRLSHFLRGRKGTPVAAHAVGERFVLLDGQTELVPMERFDLGRALDFRATSFTRTGVDAAAALTFAGKSQTERAPAYLRARRSGGDLVVSWQAVGRLGGGARVGMGQFFTGFRVELGGTAWETAASTLTIPYAAGTLRVYQLNSITGAGPAAAIEV